MKSIGLILKWLFFLGLSYLFSYMLVLGAYMGIESGKIWEVTISQFITLAPVLLVVIYIDGFCILNVLFPVKKPKWYLDYCTFFVGFLGQKVDKKNKSIN